MASTASTLAAEPAAELLAAPLGGLLAAPLGGLATGLTAAALCARWRTMKAPEVPHKGGAIVYCLDVLHTVCVVILRFLGSFGFHFLVKLAPK